MFLKNLNIILYFIIILVIINFIGFNITTAYFGIKNIDLYNYTPISINYLDGTENLTDFQILVIFDSSELISKSKMKPDCSDIRFYDSDGSTELSFWLEDGCNTNETKVWVRVPEIYPHSTKIIYLKYDNTSESASNPYTTFDFFDDFDGNMLNSSKWYSQNSSGGNFIVDSGKLILSTQSPNDYIWIHSLDKFNNFSWLEIKTLNSLGQPTFGIGYTNSTTLNPSYNLPQGYTADWRFASNINSPVYAIWLPKTNFVDIYAYGIPNSNLFPSYSLLGFGSSHTFRPFSVNYTYLLISGTDSNYYSPIFSFGIHGIDGYGSVEVDWARVRKSADTEPVVVAGPQIVVSSPIHYSIYKPGIYNFTFFTIYDKNLTCTLFINNISVSNSQVENNTLMNLSASFSSEGLYNWYINCFDSRFNVNSATYSIIITDDSKWMYSDLLLIDNLNNPNNTINLRYRFELDTKSLILKNKMKSDCSDIRFYDLDESTFLNYWIEKGCNTPHTVFWIKIPYLRSYSIKKIKYIYGNNNATSASNGIPVFDFFDDFSNKDESKWWWTLNWEVSNGYLNHTSIYDNSFHFYQWGHWFFSKFKSNISTDNGLNLHSSAWGSEEYIGGNCGVILYNVFDGEKWWNAPYFTISSSWYGFFDHICGGSGNCPSSPFNNKYNLYHTVIFSDNQYWKFNNELIDNRTVLINPQVERFSLDGKCRVSFDYIFVYMNPKTFSSSQTCYCNSCEECNDALNNNNCIIVYLNSDIFNSPETCINNPENFNNKVFDCQGHVIDGNLNINTKGIFLNKKENVSIKNCIITDFEDGIEFIETPNSNIINNTISNNLINGIKLNSNSNNAIILKNYFYNNTYGLILTDADNSLVYNNTFINNINSSIILFNESELNLLSNNLISYGLNGITFWLVSNNRIEKNLIKNTNLSILLNQSVTNILTENILNLNNYGVYLDSSSNNTLTNNIASTNNEYGIYLYSSSNNNIYNNFFKNTNNFYFDGIIYANRWNTTKAPGTNIVGGNYIGGNFWATPDGTGFSENCTDSDKDGICDSSYILVTNNIDYLPLAQIPVCYCDSCSNCIDKLNDAFCIEVKLTADISNWEGDCIYNPENFNNKIFDCQGHTIDGSEYGYGVYLYNNQNNIIKNCIITDFEYGIYLESSSNIILVNNTANSNSYGILLYDSTNNIISNSSISENEDTGIYLESSSNNMLTNNNVNSNYYGIYLYDSTNNIISNSSISENEDTGIYLYFSSNNILINNNVNSNYYGIEVYVGHNNNLSSNNICYNIHYDIFNEGYSTIGNNNTCETTYKYNDENSDGCYNLCPFNGCDCTSCNECTYKLSNVLCSQVNLIKDISNHSRYFCIYNPENFNNKIFDCQGHTIDGSEYGYGVYLYNNQNNIIKNCIITDFEYGIYLESSSNIILVNNTANSNSYGIYLYDSTNNTISNSSISENEDIGIYLESSSNNMLTNNNAIFNLWSGIYLYGSSNNTLKNNVMKKNTYNFEVYSWKSYDVSHYYQDIDTSNTVDGKPIYYWTNEKNAPNNCKNAEINESTNAGFVALVSCDNITVKNLNLSKNSHGILLVNTTNSKILNNIANLNEDSGIYLESSSNIILVNNTANSNSYGILLYDSTNNIISNSSISENEDTGIYLYFSSNNILINNNVNSNYYGIEVYVGHNNNLSSNNICYNIHYDIFNEGYSTIGNNNTCETTYKYNDENSDGCYNLCPFNGCDCTSCNECTYKLSNVLCSQVNLIKDISNHSRYFCIYNPENFNNKIFDCQGHTIDGMHIEYTNGIYLYEKENNIIKNCIITDFEDGIYLYASSNNTLINNTINLNSNTGISFYSSNENNIFYNKICYNSYGLYNNLKINTNIIDNNTFCADFINPPSSWILSFSNISVNVSNILFTPTSCSLKINNQHYGFNDSVSDFQETRFEFSEISSEGIYNINVYCNDSIGTNYANNSIQIVIGDLSVQDILIEPSEVYTDTQITVKAKIYSTAQSSPKLKLFIDGNVYKYERVNLFSGINDLSYSIGALSAGEHTIKIEIDSDNEYSEINENNNILEKTITIKQYLTCPICPEPSEWSECINGIQTRVVWICGPQTGFVCKSNIETRTCYINISEEENITQNITPSENISQNITPSENITFPYQNFTNIIQSATNYILSQPPISIGLGIIQGTNKIIQELISIFQRPVTCGNKICDPNETIYNCPGDCPKIEQLTPLVIAIILVISSLAWALKKRAIKKAKVKKIIKKLKK